MYDDFQTQIIGLFRSLHGQLGAVVNQYCQPLGITWPQALILKELAEHDEISISELARRLGFTNSNVSSICKRLEKGGFPTRTRDVSDQRTVRVALTHYAKKTADTIREDEQNLCLLSGASEEDKRIIIDGFSRLNRLISRNMSKLPPAEELLPAQWIQKNSRGPSSGPRCTIDQ